MDDASLSPETRRYLERERAAIAAELPPDPLAALAAAEAAVEEAKARASAAEDQVRRFGPPPDPPPPPPSDDPDEQKRRELAWSRSLQTSWREWQRGRQPTLDALQRIREEVEIAERAFKALRGRVRVLERIDQQLSEDTPQRQ